MKGLISLSESLLEFLLPTGEIGNLSVTADGSYDHERQVLTLELRTALHVQGTLRADYRPAWIPHPEVVQEHVSIDEATALSRDVFRHWVEKVHQRIPAEMRYPHARATAQD